MVMKILNNGYCDNSNPGDDKYNDSASGVSSAH